MTTNEKSAQGAINADKWRETPQFRPSDFAALGNPSCSKWGKSEIEWIALAYVQALENDGDEWKPLTRERTYELLTEEQKRKAYMPFFTMDFDTYKWWFKLVSEQITDSDGALGVGGFWSRRNLERTRSTP